MRKYGRYFITGASRSILPFSTSCMDGHSNERLGNRRHVKKRARRDGILLPSYIPDAGAGRVRDPIILDNSDRKTRQVLPLNQPFQDRLKLLPVAVRRGVPRIIKEFYAFRATILLCDIANIRKTD